MCSIWLPFSDTKWYVAWPSRSTTWSSRRPNGRNHSEYWRSHGWGHPTVRDGVTWITWCGLGRCLVTLYPARQTNAQYRRIKKSNIHVMVWKLLCNVFNIIGTFCTMIITSKYSHILLNYMVVTVQWMAKLNQGKAS